MLACGSHWMTVQQHRFPGQIIEASLKTGKFYVATTLQEVGDLFVTTFGGHSSLQMTMDRVGDLFKSDDHKKAVIGRFSEDLDCHL
jgi:hypothetical protein